MKVTSIYKSQRHFIPSLAVKIVKNKTAWTERKKKMEKENIREEDKIKDLSQIRRYVKRIKMRVRNECVWK